MIHGRHIMHTVYSYGSGYYEWTHDDEWVRGEPVLADAIEAWLKEVEEE